MFPNLMVASVLVLTALVGLILSPVQSSDAPLGQTVAQLIASLELDRHGDLGSTPPPANGTINAKRKIPSLVDDSDELTARSFLDTEQIAEFNDSGRGYKIHLPGGVCITTVIGNLEGPTGAIIQNATVGDILKALYHVPDWSLNQYLQNRISTLQAKMNASISDVVCDPRPGPSRNLAYRFDLTEHEGFWEAYLVATLGIMGIGFAGLHLGVIHEGITANITGYQEVWILTMTGVAQFIFGTMMFRLQTKGHIGAVEAAILNFFIIMGEWIWWAFQKIGTGTCYAASAIQSCLVYMANCGPNNLRDFNPRSLTTGGESTVDLVGQDIEQGRQQIPPGQTCV